MAQRTLGEELYEFTQTLYDFAEQDRREIHQAIVNYLRQLNLSYMALFVQIKNRRENVLTSVQEWSYNSLRNNQTDDLYAKDQSKGQVRYAFLKICDLWIVSKDENALEGSKNYIDLFNNIKEDANDIPRYNNSVIEGQKPVYTSIIIVIRDLRGNPFGAVNFEFSEYIGYDNELANELYRIAKAIGILHSLEEIHVNQKNSREQFCRRLEQKWTSDKPIVRSFVFLGYPGEESSAIQIIKASLAKMVKEYGFQVKDWQDISDQGNIDQQLLTTIKSCLCGIFYLSQKDETFNGKAKFRCNHNVFFEAGIMSGKSNNFNNVILISEENRYHIEEEMPFDTKSIRQIIVRRIGPEHTIDSERLEREIENQIKSFFNKLDSNKRAY